jgi:hypothetical protein
MTTGKLELIFRMADSSRRGMYMVKLFSSNEEMSRILRLNLNEGGRRFVARWAELEIHYGGKEFPGPTTRISPA